MGGTQPPQPIQPIVAIISPKIPTEHAGNEGTVLGDSVREWYPTTRA